MEHRNYQRKDVWVDAKIWLRTGKPLNACINNVGGEGAYIQVDGLEHSPCHRVEVEFVATLGGEPARYRWPALIVHRSSAGIGVLFLVNEIETVPVLRALVHAAESSLEAERAGDGKVLALRRKRSNLPGVRGVDGSPETSLTHPAGKGVAGR